MSTTNTEFATAIVASVLSSGGLWTTLQFFLNRRHRHDQARREALQDSKDDAEVERREVDRRELLAKAQATAQRAALESAATRYKELDQAYQVCRKGLADLSHATNLMIDVFETLMFRLHPKGADEIYVAELQLSEIGEVRRTINEARRHLR